jgi:hypothetical protein
MSGDYIPDVTPEMVRAGVLEAREHTLGESLEDLVKRVYLAMALERGGNSSASDTSLDK